MSLIKKFFNNDNMHEVYILHKIDSNSHTSFLNRRVLINNYDELGKYVSKIYFDPFHDKQPSIDLETYGYFCPSKNSLVLELKDKDYFVVIKKL